MSILLFERESGRRLGELTEEQFSSLRSMLEEESSADQDYFVSPDVIDYLEENGADAALVQLLRQAVGEGEGIEVAWKKA